MNKGELLSGLSLAAFAVFVIQQSRALPYYYEHGPGPGFLPLWTGVGLFILAVILAVRSLVPREKKQEHDREERERIARAIGTWVGFIAMIAFVNVIGFLASFAVFTFFLVIVLDRQPVAKAAAVSLGSVFGFYLLFVYAFGQRLPTGPWGF